MLKLELLMKSGATVTHTIQVTEDFDMNRHGADLLEELAGPGGHLTGFDAETGDAVFVDCDEIAAARMCLHVPVIA